MSLVNQNPLAPLAADLRSGKIALKDFYEHVFEMLDSVDSQVQAFVPEPGRRERVMADVAALEEKYPDPADRPPLFGIPFGVKDIFHVDGLPTQAGSQLPAEELTGKEAAYVTQFKKAGAIVLGKTVTTEFAYFDPGPTRNPHNLNHTPGGSSSGSAAAVAAGLIPLASGTQTIGSVVRPAAFCGVFGFKPTYGRINPAGVLYVSRSLDHVGLFTQDVAGMQLAASIVCKKWKPKKVSGKPVLGVPEGPYLKQAEPEALSAFETHLAKLELAGYTVKRIPALTDIEIIAKRHQELMAAEMAREHAKLYPKFKDLYRPRTAALIEEGLAVSDETLAAHRKAQLQFREDIQAQMKTEGIDLWVAPSAPGPAPEGIDATGNPKMNLPWTQSGLPSVNVPAGIAANGLPLGVQLVGLFGADEQLLAWSDGVMAVFS